jgi:hypothetical protein
LFNPPGRYGPAVISSADPRARERQQLKLAVATFALHLDAFEMLAKEALRLRGDPNDKSRRPLARKDAESDRQ